MGRRFGLVLAAACAALITATVIVAVVHRTPAPKPQTQSAPTAPPGPSSVPVATPAPAAAPTGGGPGSSPGSPGTHAASAPGLASVNVQQGSFSGGGSGDDQARQDRLDAQADARQDRADARQAERDSHDPGCQTCP
jgi:hypothetical protein